MTGAEIGESRSWPVGCCYSPGRRWFDYILNSNEFKLPQNLPNFDRSKNNLFLVEQFGIKYGFEGLEKMNNFLHRNFFRFGMDFKWKIQEFSRLKFERI
jgi:hypothetical protein